MTNPTPVTFLHLRAIMPPTNPLDALLGMRQHDCFGGATLAMQENGNDLNIALARCNGGKIKNGKRVGADRYVKKEGRARATERLHAPADDVEANKWRGTIKDMSADGFIQYLESLDDVNLKTFTQFLNK